MYAVARFDAEVVKLLLVHGGGCENETVNRMISTILTGDTNQASNRQAILNYLQHLMVIEEGPLSSIEFFARTWGYS
jgi:predicted SnoaL-like aldol condensation-catalyzing enzyme